MQMDERSILSLYKNLARCLPSESGKPIKSSSNSLFTYHSYPLCCSQSAPCRSLPSQLSLVRNMAITITRDLRSRSERKQGGRETGSTQRPTTGAASKPVNETIAIDRQQHNS
jgi:hypothetical protein